VSGAASTTTAASGVSLVLPPWHAAIAISARYLMAGSVGACVAVVDAQQPTAPHSLRETRISTAAIAALERCFPLRGRAVRELLGLHVALCLLLQRVVADLRRGVERLVDIAGLDDAAAVGVLGPRAGEAVRLQLDVNRIRGAMP